MTARELLDEILSQGPPSDALPLECRLIFRTIRDNIHQVQLRNGTPLRDLSDVRELFGELIELLAPRPANGRSAPKLEQQLRQEQPRNWNVCPDCGHEHADQNECGWAIGGGRTCRCERKVTA